MIGVAVLFVPLVAALIDINTRLKPKLDALGGNQQQTSSVIPAARGMIFDARGRVVAASRRVPDVFIDPALCDNVPALAEKLSPVLGVPAGDILRKVEERPNSRFVVVATGIDEVELQSIRALGERAVGVSERFERYYPLGRSMAHVLGFVGRDGAGLEGIERAFDSHLRGVDGRRATIRTAGRRAMWRAPDDGVEPIDGGHVMLTIDAELQRMLEEALARGIHVVEAKGGVAVAMNPQDGSVLAMVSYPDFDPNDAASASADQRRNRAITDPIEPGSTIKPFVAGAALDGGFVNLRERFNTHWGTYRLGRRTITDVSPQPSLDFRGILVKSSNIGMTQLAARVGNPTLHATMERYGFGRRTGVELIGEHPGVVYPLRKWTHYTNTSVAMGYEIMMTPLQLLAGFCAILNDGVTVPAHVVETRLNRNGEPLETEATQPGAVQALSENVARLLYQDILVDVIEEGSGKKAKVEGYRVCGKTGTPKLAYKDRLGYEPGAYLGVFLGAAPADKPAIAVVVLIRRPNPRINYYGGQVAAPVAREFLAEALPYLGVEPDNVLLTSGR